MPFPRLSLPEIPIHFFRGAPTDHVIVYRSGRIVAEALGGSFLVFPWNTLVRVPQAEQTYAFTVREASSDLQDMTVTGEVRVRLVVETLVKRRDLSVDAKTGTALTQDLQKIESEVRNALSGYVRRQIAADTLRSLLTKTDVVRNAMFTEIGTDAKVFVDLGVEIVGLVITAIAPSNTQLRQALEAETREQMMAAADRAVHDRRMKSAEADRTVKTYEIETQKTVEEGRRQLIAVTNANLIATAEAEAKATVERLAPYRDMAPEVLFALALQKAAENGIETLNVSPDLLSAFRQVAKAV